jgi:hypothetical protein
MKHTPAIITFSRRTDPAFFMDWLLDNLQAGECEAPNPFSGRLYRVSLRREDVLLFNFWTKAPHATIPGARALRERGYPLAYFISLTGYPRWLERRVPDVSTTSRAIGELERLLGPDCLWWRYDPIIITERLTQEWHVENFTRLCGTAWAGKTRRVIISLAHIDGPYLPCRTSLERAAASAGDRLAMPGYDGFIGLARKLSAIAASHGMKLEVCCSPAVRREDSADIAQASCLSAEYLSRIIPGLPALRKKGTRRGSARMGYAPCGCVESRDIGTVRTCPHGCVYCYANRGAR